MHPRSVKKKLVLFFLSLYHYVLAWAGAVFFLFPSRRIRVIGVTGTKGKTTTVALLGHIFNFAQRPAATLSSFSVCVGDVCQKNMTGNTMPGRFFIQRFLRRAVRRGCEYAFVEVTSQGVSQHRHRGIFWFAGAFLGIHPEHIEAHGSFEKYRSAKADFFRYISAHGKGKTKCFINRDDQEADFFARAAGASEVIFFSGSSLASVMPETLPGLFNKANVACAWAIARDQGIADATIVDALKVFAGVEGRSMIVMRHPFTTLIDYAHTPISLDGVYRMAKDIAVQSGGRIIGVLGSAGGGRDVWKRPAMGARASLWCDAVILTDEDPYDEDPLSIIASLRDGFEAEKKRNNHGQTCEVVVDRQKAINHALRIARRGDVVVITGKGSEPWIHGPRGTKRPWSERAAVASAMKERGTELYP